MGDLLIRNIPESWKADLENLAKREARARGDVAREVFRAGLDAVARQRVAEDEVPPGDRMKAVFRGVFETDAEADEFQRTLDEVRRSDFGRPPSDLG